MKYWMREKNYEATGGGWWIYKNLIIEGQKIRERESD